MYWKMQASVNSFLSYALELSGANPVSLFTLLLVLPQILSSHHGGVAASARSQFWEFSSTFGVLKSLMTVTFLSY